MCTYLPGFRCEERSSKWVATFDNGPAFVAMDNVTKKSCVVDTDDSSWDVTRMIQPIPVGWSPTSDTSNGCHSAAMDMIGKPHRCYIIGGSSLNSDQNFCDSNPRFSAEKLAKENDLSISALIPIPLLPLVLGLIWFIVERCSLLPQDEAGAERMAGLSSSYVAVRQPDHSKYTAMRSNTGEQDVGDTEREPTTGEIAPLMKPSNEEAGPKPKTGLGWLLACGRR